MKKLFTYALAPAFVLALGATSPAFAQDAGAQAEGPPSEGPPNGDNGIRKKDPVSAYVRAYKDRKVLEVVLKAKLVLVLSGGIIPTDGAAESDVIVKQKNYDQTVDHRHPTDGNPNPLELDAVMNGSFNGNEGIIQANQDVGNMVNQGNVASVAITGSETALTDANAAASQVNKDNLSGTTVPLDIGNWNKDNRIINSLNGNSGVIHVNQNSGDMNNQLNITSGAVGDGSIVAMADAELGQFNTGNTVFDVNSQKRDRILGSVNGNSGIVNVNQSSGKFNNQATVVSFAGSATIN